MTSVRHLDPDDVATLVTRVGDRLALDAHTQPLVNPSISTQLLSESLRDAAGATWVAEQDGVIVGHLHGALLESATYGNGVWIGPDGASFDSTDILSDLYSAAGATWIERGALEHYVWTIDDIASTQPWYEMGFARMHMRGVLRLDDRDDHPLPEGYALRRGGVEDLDIAIALDEMCIRDRTGNAKLDEALNVHLEYLDESLAKRLTQSERATLTSLLTKLNSSR